MRRRRLTETEDRLIRLLMIRNLRKQGDARFASTREGKGR